jgi:hypothetical protein
VTARAERRRVESFGRLEDGLRQASDWYLWGPAPGLTATRSCCSAATRPTPPGSSATPIPPPYPKDGINDHVVGGADSVDPERRGTKAAFWYGAEIDIIRRPPGSDIRSLKDLLRPAPGGRT